MLDLNADNFFKDPMLQVQINAHDNYSIEYAGEKFHKVPVIRIYGRTNTGSNILVHIHDVFPYFVIKKPFHEENVTFEEDCQLLHKNLEDLLWDFYSKKKAFDDESEDSVDKDLNSEEVDVDSAQVDESLTKFRKKKTLKSKTSGSTKPAKNIDRSKTFKYIAKVEVIKGKEFYGYHEDYEVFYKVSLLRPNSLKRLVDLLSKDENCNVIPGFGNDDHIKILEAHLPFFLQFCIDYNLYGCSWLNLKKFTYRLPVFNEDSSAIFCDEHFLEVIESVQYNSFSRMGNSLLEIDITAEDILNADMLLIPPTDDPKDAISSTNVLWNTLDIIRNTVGLASFKSSQSQSKAFLRSDFVSEHHGIIKKSYEALVQKDKSQHFVRSHLNTTIESLPTLLESNLNRKVDFTLHENKSIKQCNSISPRKLKAGFESSKNKRAEFESSKNKRAEVESSKNKRAEVESSKNKRAEFESNKNKRAKTEERSNYIQTQVSMTEAGLKDTKQLTYNSIEDSLEELGFKKHEYQSPYFQDALEYRKFKNRKAVNAKSDTINCADPREKPQVKFKDENIRPNSLFYSKTGSISYSKTDSLSYSQPGILEYMRKPPTYNELVAEMPKVERNSALKYNPYGSFFQSQTQNIISKSWKHKHKLLKNKISIHSTDSGTKLNHPLSIMFVEITTSTQMNGKLPDPELNEVLVITWILENGDVGALQHHMGMFVKMSEDSLESKVFMNQMNKKHRKDFEVVFYKTELELITKFSEFVAIIDPDILCGFEVHNDSWGFLLNRGDFLGVDLAAVISRVNSQQVNKMGDFWGYTHASSIRITGRHMLNLWRTLKTETKLESFTLENFAYHLLHKRIPKFSSDCIFENWTAHNYKAVIQNSILKVKVCVDMVRSLSIIENISEQARITGVDFYSVIYRGSQFKVESLLSRICRRDHYLMYSPSQKNVRTQKPMECIALIMEPDSQLYTDPLVVLDFQSLYPSIMIAFNLCYSTLIGDTNLLQKDPVMLGADKHFELKQGLLHEVGLENMLLTTNGSLFLKEHKRKGILAKMLTNLLETRVMIKTTINDLKNANSDINFDTLLRDLDGMQMALKYVLNVTYGYTAASHSGRMPLQELADSVVEMGRTVLTKSIHLINNSCKWGAKVVYTDTDSLFILFPGKTRKEAFEYGREIANIITESNPFPIKLTFEKLYHPCILVTKKRYVGNMYEHEKVTEPVLQAKGLEIIRRDGTPLLQKLMETSIKLLFDTSSITVVQNFLTAEFEKLYRGKYLVQDLCFSRKVKLGHYKKENSLPPAAYLAKEALEDDSRAETQYKQTVRYVVVKKENKKALLREKVMTPTDFMKNRKHQNLQLDMEYYILKHIISPLNRIYNLIGVDCEPWFNDVKSKFSNQYETAFQDKKINNAMLSKVSIKYCEHCHEIRVLPSMKLCFKCLKQYDVFLKNERNSLKNVMKKDVLNSICQNCIGFENRSLVGSCVSQDCPIYYQREDY